MIVNRIKPYKIPEWLIYKNKSKDTYYMISTKTFDTVGSLKARPMLLQDNSYYPEIKAPTKSLYIRDLKAFVKRSGIGSEFIKFCKYLSRKEGAEGRVHVIAYNTDHPGIPPHIFYRKKGFAATNPDETKLIDKAIKNNTIIPPEMCQGTPMYLKKYWIA